MSVTRRDGTKIVLPRSGPDQFWQRVHESFAQDGQRHWKYLAMLALRENSHWSLEQIGRVFGHNKGHVTRCLQSITEEIRSRLTLDDVRQRPVDRRPPPNTPDERDGILR